jgi:hypothetical protein
MPALFQTRLGLENPTEPYQIVTNWSNLTQTVPAFTGYNPFTNQAKWMPGELGQGYLNYKTIYIQALYAIMHRHRNLRWEDRTYNIGYLFLNQH